MDFRHFVPEGVPEGYYIGADLILWLVSIGILWVLTFFFFRLAVRNKELPSVYSLQRAMGLFMIFMSLNKICYILAYWIPYYESMVALGYTTGLLSMLGILYSFEKYIVKRTHYLFTIYASIITIFSLFLLIMPEQRALFRSITSISGMVIPLAVILAFLWLAFASTGEVRTKSIGTLVGMIMIEIGFFLEGEMVASSGFIS